MTIEHLKEAAMVPGMEGLGGYHWEFNEDIFADLLVDEFIKWARPALGMGECDEAALKEHLGL